MPTSAKLNWVCSVFVQRSRLGDANGRTVYRVYTDPLKTPDDVNRTSSLLAGAGIEVLLKRVSD